MPGSATRIAAFVVGMTLAAGSAFAQVGGPSSSRSAPTGSDVTSGARVPTVGSGIPAEVTSRGSGAGSALDVTGSIGGSSDDTIVVRDAPRRARVTRP